MAGTISLACFRGIETLPLRQRISPATAVAAKVAIVTNVVITFWAGKFDTSKPPPFFPPGFAMNMEIAPFHPGDAEQRAVVPHPSPHYTPKSTQKKARRKIPTGLVKISSA
jgi:hypothetical protein